MWVTIRSSVLAGTSESIHSCAALVEAVEAYMISETWEVILKCYVVLLQFEFVLFS